MKAVMSCIMGIVCISWSLTFTRDSKYVKPAFIDSFHPLGAVQQAVYTILTLHLMKLTFKETNGVLEFEITKLGEEK